MRRARQTSAPLPRRQEDDECEVSLWPFHFWRWPRPRPASHNFRRFRACRGRRSLCRRPRLKQERAVVTNACPTPHVAAARFARRYVLKNARRANEAPKTTMRIRQTIAVTGTVAERSLDKASRGNGRPRDRPRNARVGQGAGEVHAPSGSPKWFPLDGEGANRFEATADVLPAASASAQTSRRERQLAAPASRKASSS